MGSTLDGLKGIAVSRGSVEMVLKLPPLPQRKNLVHTLSMDSDELEIEANRLMERIGQK